MGQSLLAMSIAVQLIVWLIIDVFALQEPLPYVPKMKRKHRCYSPFPMQCTIPRCAATIMTWVGNMKVQIHYRAPGLHYSSHRHRHKKRKLFHLAPFTGMTTTWDSHHSPSQGTFDSDAQSLMLDDGASACITNDKEDFIEPPKWVDRKVKGIKGHANATHRGTIKWHIEDDQGLVHVMIIRGAYQIPNAPTCTLSPLRMTKVG